MVSRTLSPPCGRISSARLVAFTWMGSEPKWSVISSLSINKNLSASSNFERNSFKPLRRTSCLSSRIRVSTQLSPNRAW